MSLRIVELVPGTQESKNHTFAFASNDAGRAQSDAVKAVLGAAITQLKNLAPSSSPQNAPGAGGAPAAMAIAAAVSAGGRSSSNSQFDDDKLLANQSLQQQFLASNKQLGSTFAESMKAKPASIALTAFVRQFWLSRIKLLRAFAIQQSQKRGDYNVLATIKPVKVDDELKLAVTAEQVTLILHQHPVVQKAKAQLSTKVNQSEFWTRFFQSRLFKKLKGEKLLDSDKHDELLDTYLEDHDESQGRSKKLSAVHVPNIIDLEGNEQDNSQKQGNRPDIGDRPQAHDRVPIMRALNSLSGKLVEQVAPNDVDPSEPIGIDEATFKEMQLRDLTGTSEANRIELHIRDKAKFFATGKGSDESQTRRLYDQQTPEDVLRVLRSDISSASRTGLTEAIGVDDSDSDDDMDDGAAPAPTHAGGRSSRRNATLQVFNSIKDRRARAEDQFASTDEEGIADELGLTAASYRNILLAQAAAQVFLNHFWSVYHTGDPGQAVELEGVAEALVQTIEGIKTAGNAAEKERQQEITKTKDRYRAHYQRTGVKPQPFDSDSVKGGQRAIDQLMASTVRSTRFALETYKGALGLARAAEAARAQD